MVETEIWFLLRLVFVLVKKLQDGGAKVKVPLHKLKEGSQVLTVLSEPADCVSACDLRHTFGQLCCLAFEIFKGQTLLVLLQIAVA